MQDDDRQFPTPVFTARHRTEIFSIPRSPWRLLILPQIHQQLPKLLLPSARRSALGTLPAQIHQFANSLPAGAARAGVLAVGEEFFGFFAGAGDGFVLFGIVVFVEVVDVALGFGDAFGFLGGGGFFSLGDFGVALGSPESGCVGRG